MIIHRVEHNRRRLPMHVHVCESRAERGRGLLLRPRPDRRTAWLLQRCTTVHTIGMLYPIDVLFCDGSGRIVRIVENLRPWRVVRCGSAREVWELRGGAAATWGWKIGDRVTPC